MKTHKTQAIKITLPQQIMVSFVLIMMVSTVAWAAAEPTTTEIDTLVVRGIKEALGEYVRPVEEGDLIQNVLKNSPFAFIRRGSAWASDLYSDGLKRNDITVTVDGERFCTACPNRMDTKVAQVDLMNIDWVTMSRNSAVLQSGLGGQVDFQRRQPGEETMVYGQIMGTFDHTEEFDGSISVEGNRMRIGGRYRSGKPYTNADDQTFKDLYGYTDPRTAEIFEIRGHKTYDSGDAVATYENTKDVLFPYLLMDERTNDHYQASASYSGHRVYFNRNEHYMDNYLRTSLYMTDMITDATNTMFGVVGSKYEVFARHWDADNRITPVSMPAAEKLNHMIPDVWRIGASVQHEMGDEDNPWLFMRAGIAQTKVHDDTQLSMYQNLESDAELTKWSIPFGVTASHLIDLSEEFMMGFSAEVSSDAPSIEQQYISVDKPGTKADWVGNPNLNDPIRATARLAVQRDFVKLEVFATHIWNYPYLLKRSVEGAMFLTYEGVDAIMAGANLFANWKTIDVGMIWNWGEKTEDSSPLSEIQPVTLFVAAETPTYGNFHGTMRYQHAASQHRVDVSMDETTTGSWNTLDLGVVMELDKIRLALAAENMTNSLYSQHLSYQRNPFASGVQVFEPGRTIRATATYAF